MLLQEQLTQASLLPDALVQESTDSLSEQSNTSFM
jgi:hypothetical protein